MDNEIEIQTEKYASPAFSTTRRLTRSCSKIVNNPDDKFHSLLFFPENKDRKYEGGLRINGYFKKTYNNKPLVSIITVVLNGEKYLEETIQSVLHQTYDNVEYIIIDGGSTDGTVAIIKKYDDKIDYWVSERDEGIYDAMNKGLCLAAGDYISILNSDDYYMKNAVERSIKKIIQTNCDYSIAQIWNIENQQTLKPIFPLKKKIYQEMPYPHITAFIKKNVYKKLGLFNTQFKIAADHDMAVKIILGGYKAVYIPQTIAFLNTGGISFSYKSYRESLAVAINNGKPLLNAYFTYYVNVIKRVVAETFPDRYVKLIMRMINSRKL